MSLTLNLPPKTSNLASCTRDLQFERQLGQGAFGQVYKARIRRSGQIVAVKVNIEKEVWIHSQLDHPHVVKMLDFFQEDDRVYMVLEYINGGNLFKFMTRHRKLEKELVKKIFGQTVHAIKYIHQQGYLMRDLKPENMLLDQNQDIKVCDFGWAVSLKEHSLRKARAGTYAYMSPESLMGNIQDQKTDLWSLGILLYELHMGKEPFPGKSSSDMLHLISNQPIKFSSKFFTRESMNLVKSLLKFKPFKRIDINGLLASNFLRKYTKINFRYKDERPKPAGRIHLGGSQRRKRSHRPMEQPESCQTYGSKNVTQNSSKNFSFDPPGKIFTSRFKTNPQIAGEHSMAVKSNQKFMHSDYYEEPYNKTLLKNSSRREGHSLSLYHIHDQTKGMRGRNRLTSRGKRNPMHATPAKIQITSSNRKLGKKSTRSSKQKRKRNRKQESKEIQTPKTVRKNQRFENLQILLQESSNQSLGFLSKDDQNNLETTQGSSSNFHFFKTKPRKQDQRTPLRFKKETATTKVEVTASGSNEPYQQSSLKTRTFNSHKGKDLLSISIGQCKSNEMEKFNSISLSGAINLGKREMSENKDFKSEEHHFAKSQISKKLKNQMTTSSKKSGKEKNSEELDEKRKFDEYADNNSKLASAPKTVQIAKVLNSTQSQRQPMSKSMVNWMKYHQDPYQRNKNYLLDSNSKISLETKAFGDSFGNLTLNRRGEDSLAGINDSEILKNRDMSADSFKKMSSSCVKRKKRKKLRPSMRQTSAGRALALLKKQMQNSKLSKDHQMQQTEASLQAAHPGERQRMMSLAVVNTSLQDPKNDKILKSSKRNKRRRKTETEKEEYNMQTRKMNYQRLKNNIMKQKIQKLVAQSNLNNLKNELEKITNRSRNDCDFEYKIGAPGPGNGHPKRLGRRRSTQEQAEAQHQNRFENMYAQNKSINSIRSPLKANHSITKKSETKFHANPASKNVIKIEENKMDLLKMISGDPSSQTGLVHRVRIIHRSVSRKKLNASHSNFKENEAIVANKVIAREPLPQVNSSQNQIKKQNSRINLISKQMSEYGELMKAATLEIKKKDLGSKFDHLEIQYDPKKGESKGSSREYLSQFSRLKANRKNSQVKMSKKRNSKKLKRMPSLGTMKGRNQLKSKEFGWGVRNTESFRGKTSVTNLKRGYSLNRNISSLNASLRGNLSGGGVFSSGMANFQSKTARLMAGKIRSEYGEYFA